jgi:SAM-dependent methyltransferase
MSLATANSYSQRWFETFHSGISEERTNKEIEFICAVAPLPDFRKVLDVCCGMGRHARALAARGYQVTGLERDAAAVARAGVLAGGPTYIQRDVRDYRPEHSAFDLAIVMSQSFGYYDEAANHELLQRLANGIRHGGRIILDLWNPEFFAAHQGERELKLPGRTVHETKRVSNGRLFVSLDYPDGERDAFEWQVFTPVEMKALAESTGLALITSCTNFGTTREPSPLNPRIQFVLERCAKPASC